MRGAVKFTGSLLAVFMALLAGCASVEPGRAGGDLAPVEMIDPATGQRPSSAEPAAPEPTPASGVTSIEISEPLLKPEPVPDAPRTVYFDFDSYTVKDEYRAALEAHARSLSRNNGMRLRIQGHTDDRGGREYNLALGQKRAETVAKILTGLGVAWSQLESISYGEERPAAKGRGETAWAQNRRAELEYR